MIEMNAATASNLSSLITHLKEIMRVVNNLGQIGGGGGAQIGVANLIGVSISISCHFSCYFCC